MESQSRAPMHRRTRAAAGASTRRSLAERRYAACDPENRLIAAQLEKRWEAALHRVEACEARLAAQDAPRSDANAADFTGLAADLEAAWTAPGVTMRTRQQLVRALIADIIADVDEATREVVLDDPLARRPALGTARPQAEDRASTAAAPPKKLWR